MIRRLLALAAISLVVASACDSSGAAAIPSGAAAIPTLAATPSPASEGTQEPLLPATHIAPPARGTYNTDPPTSGAHYSVPGYAPTKWGFYDQLQPPEVWIHNAEHGGVIVLYRSSTDADTVRNFIAGAPLDPDFGEVKMVGTQYPIPGHRFALVAWGWLELMDTWDAGAAQRFYLAHVDRGPELIP